MKKSVLTALLATFIAGASAADKISLGVSATYSPFKPLDASNRIVGFDIDLATALCKQTQAGCAFVDHTSDSLILALRFKKYDAVISGMDITPKYSKQVVFTRSYHVSSALMIVKEDTYKIFAGLKDKCTSIENGTTYQKYLQDKHPEVKTMVYDSCQNTIINPKNGRIGGASGNTAVVNKWLKTNPQPSVATDKATDPQYFGIDFGITVRLGNEALLEKLNSTLAAIKADGTYKKISGQWLPQ